MTDHTAGRSEPSAPSRGSLCLTRAWDMPNANTFLIPTVARLLNLLVGDGVGWVDPFANANSPAQHTNDIDAAMPTGSHMDARDFLAGFEECSVDGVLLDPPYSARQIREMYAGHGNTKQITAVIREAARIVRVGGLVLSFGWNSNGVGAKRGFVAEAVHLIAHGGQHNDTIITVERKAHHQSRFFW